MFSTRAESELKEAEGWYEAQRPGLGAEFLAAISEALERLAEWPKLGPLVTSIETPSGARSVFVRRFSYSVVFIEVGEDLWVIAFANQRKRPGYWRRRRIGSS